MQKLNIDLQLHFNDRCHRLGIYKNCDVVFVKFISYRYKQDSLKARRATKGSGIAITNVVGEDHMLGSSCQWYNWQTGRCGSIAFGSSPRRGKTLISKPRCLAEVSTSGKEFRR